MEQKPLTIIVTILLLFVAAAAGAYFYMNSASIQEAALVIESGNVEVDQGNGFMAASDGMELSLQDTIKTSAGTTASVILYESIIIELDELTEIILEELSSDAVRIAQKSGSTWNQFSNALGVTSFTLATPSAVATVRGTQFGAGPEGILVGDGTVDVDVDGQFFQVESGKKVFFGEAGTELGNLTAEEKTKVQSRMRKVLLRMKSLRDAEIDVQSNKLKFIVKQAEKQGYGRDELRAYVEKTDDGVYNVDEVLTQAPVRTDGIEKIGKMTKAIQKEQRALKNIER